MSTPAPAPSTSVAAPEPALKLEIQHYSRNVAPEGCVMIRCQGRLVAGSTHILTAAVTPLLPDHKRIILDLSALQHTDSMGLGSLVKLYVSARAAGSSLELTHLSKQIRNLLGMTNLLEVFTVVGEHGVKMM